MAIDRTTIPSLLNFDTAIDWPSRISREGPFLRQVLAEGPSRRVADLGSGTGEYTCWLAEQGFEVVGIEGVSERWKVASEEAPEGVEHLLGDFGAVEAMVRGHFGAAVCLGNTLPTLIGAESLARMLSGLRRRLLPGAPFVAHLLNYDRLFASGGRVSQARALSMGDDDLVFSRLMEPREDGIVGATDTVLELGTATDATAGVLHRRHFFQQGWRSTELLTMLELAQFRNVEIYGGFSMQSFEELESEDLVVVAK